MRTIYICYLKMNEPKTSKFIIQSSQTKLINFKALEKDYKYTEQDIQYNYNPYNVHSIQCYNPTYSDLFNCETVDVNTIALNNRYHIINLNSVFDSKTQESMNTPVFIKFSPLLDPLRYMNGKYNISDEKTTKLPSFISNDATELSKLISKHNASYVDNFFCFLTSKILETHGFIHGIDYYGSFLGIQEKYKMNIIDDLEYLKGSDFFLENLGKYFNITDNESDTFIGSGSRSNKPKLIFSNSKHDHNSTAISIIDLSDSLEESSEIVDTTNLEEVYEKVDNSNHNSSESSYDSSNNSEINYSSDENSDNESNDENEDEQNSDEESEQWETDSESDDNEEAIYSYINNYPIQMICLEKCDGTLDELFMKNKINEKTGASALFQIIMILLTYQQKFGFTHNDLHTNNIMYKTTDIQFLYYKYDSKIYKVPTYGRIFKLIDFGRAIYKFQDKLYCSDSFFTGGDAATQYNFEPFMNNNKPRLDPNYSFDLCRLGTSIYDFIIDDDHKASQLDELQKTILRWCKDDNEKNVLYKRDGSERYPGFRLYKMISRTVHNHTPDEQLKFPYFNQFKLNIPDENVIVMDIDSIPIYSTI